MSRILVSGLINIETTLRVDSFPVDYSPVHYAFHAVHSSVSGVGYNIAKACCVLGHDVAFLSLIGKDAPGWLVQEKLAAESIAQQYVLVAVAETAQSVILYDSNGRRQIHVDLKDIQERAYPHDLFRKAAAGADLFALCNINFSRPFLHEARLTGKPVVTDVHAISNLDDDYNRDFLQSATILFMSDELLPVPHREWATEVMARFGPEVLVVGMGAEGALLCVKKEGAVQHIPAVTTRPVVNTIGGGDALFSAFLHGYLKFGDPYEAIRRAVLFASYKIGAASASEGFLNAAELEALNKSYEQ